MSQKQAHKLFLLDAMALIYRAHFAFSKNPRINSKGLNTGVMLGFTNTLVEVLDKEKPTHIGVAFDTKAPTFRHVQYEAYKANRLEQPEDITVSIPWVKEIVKAFRIPILEMDGFEADDIIGTLAKKAKREDFTVYMMTPDKDYGQIVEDHIYLYKPAFMGNAVDVMGPKQVCEKWDIDHVDKVRDMLGLMGDAVDNIPGIPGIGQKTAVKLLKEFGTVEGLIANVDKLKGKQRENVENFAQQGILSKELATIKIDVPVDFIDEDLKYDGIDEEKLRAIFTELEFRTLAARIFKEPSAKKATISAPAQMDLFGAPAAAATSSISITDESSEEEQVELGPPPVLDTIWSNVHNYHKVKGKAEVAELVEFLLLQKEICFDTETTALDAMQAELVGLSFSYVPGEAYYIPVSENQAETQEILGGSCDLFLKMNRSPKSAKM
jgi:DNA polymerase I